jgi:hypothetical protein
LYLVVPLVFATVVVILFERRRLGEALHAPPNGTSNPDGTPAGAAKVTGVAARAPALPPTTADS